MLALVLMMSGCSDEYFFQEVKQYEDSAWAMDDAASFAFTTQDTSTYLNFYLDLRNNNAYPYQNVYAFIEMRFPNKRVLRDTIHYPYLANDEGKWLGKGIGGAYDNSIMYKHKKKLPLPGDYSITVTQAMRDSLLRGVERVGIHIEPNRD